MFIHLYTDFRWFDNICSSMCALGHLATTFSDFLCTKLILDDISDNSCKEGINKSLTNSDSH